MKNNDKNNELSYLQYWDVNNSWMGNFAKDSTK